MTVKTAGRTDLEDFFRLSGVLTYKKLNHTPILAFVEKDGDVEVRIFHSAARLLDAFLPESTPLMCQWRGQWDSDFFQFTAGDIRTASQSLVGAR